MARQGLRGRGAGALVGACAALLASGVARAASPAAGDPRALLAAAEQPQAVAVVARVGELQVLDRSGRAATFSVETALAGSVGSSEALRGVWEELAPGRPDRFRSGERLLVVLEPLPGTSLWRSRVPDGGARLVAGEGRAFLREPGAGSLAPLAAWLALEPAAREAPAGLAGLAEVVLRGDSGLAQAAAERIGRVPELPQRSESAAATLEAVLFSPDRPPEVRRAVLRLAGERRLETLRPGVARLAADPGEPLRAEALSALAALDGALPAERTLALLESEDPAVRAAAVRGGGAALSEARLEDLLRAEAAPEVRTAIVEVLLERGGAAALPAASPLLFDSSPAVREAAVRGIAGLGAAAVPEMEALVERSDDPAEARAPLAVLALTGPEGQAALGRIALEHDAERVRALARLFLGVEPWPGH